jgi:voltage-gated potassium channel
LLENGAARTTVRIDKLRDDVALLALMVNRKLEWQYAFTKIERNDQLALESIAQLTADQDRPSQSRQKLSGNMNSALDIRCCGTQDATKLPVRVRADSMSIRYRVYVCLILLGCVVVSGSAGFHFIEGWAWFDAFYMTLTTMTTIGYGEIHPLSHAGRIFNSFLIVFAVFSGGFTIATFTQALLQFEFGKAFGRRRMERELAKLSGHYIICGAGRVGRTVARELRARGQSIVFIERNPERAEWASNEKIPVVIGDASREENLKRAHIEEAKGFVAAVGSDPENLYIVLTARGFRSDLKIIARASEDEATSKLLRAGASQVLSPYFFVGSRIAQLLLRPNVLDFIDAAFGTERLDVEIGEVRIEQNSLLVGKTLGDSVFRQQAGVIILGVKPADGMLRFNPVPETIICASDTLIVRFLRAPQNRNRGSPI